MSAKILSLFFVLVFITSSCSNNEQFPSKQFQNISLEEVEFIGDSFVRVSKTLDSENLKSFSNELADMLLYKSYYDEKHPDFNLEDLKTDWTKLKMNSQKFVFEDVTNWIDITGFLLEITNESIYAAEIERIMYLSAKKFSNEEIKKIEKLIAPWIYTKNVDHIRINMFVNSTIKYNHTLKGAVEITQETNFPETGKVQIKFKMENKRYIELYIRIPDWVKNVTIIEKGVKYVATPGEYSQIVRKWKDGNVVDIEFSMKNKPSWLQ